jgi:hypothetical protein
MGPRRRLFEDDFPDAFKDARGEVDGGLKLGF